MRYTSSLLLLALLTSGLTAQAQEAITVAEPAAPTFLNAHHQSNWVRLDAANSISGNVMVLPAAGTMEGRVGAKVLLSRGGVVLAETVADTDGAFKLSGLQPGTYAMQVRGSNTFAAFAVHVLPATQSHLANSMNVYASTLPEPFVRQLVMEQAVPVGSASSFYGDHMVDPLAGQRTVSKSPVVYLQNGALVGRLSRPGVSFSDQDLTGNIVSILSGDKVVAKTATERDGRFAVPSMRPGVYTLFVSGDDGIATMAFEAVAAPGVAKNGGSSKFVSFVAPQTGGALNVETIPPGEIVFEDDEEEFLPPVELGTPIAGGGFVGPGGFGGGFGGGGGGFGGGLGGAGGLLGIGGLAAGIAALADDDDGFNLNSPITVP